MILSIDTYSDIMGISLLDGHNLVVKQAYHKIKPFSETLISKIDSILKDLGYDLSVFYAVAVNKGPGSYTGLRVGITVAKMLSYTAEKPLFTYRSVDAMAFKYRFCRGKILTLINAGKGECYFCEFYSDGNMVESRSDIKLLKISEIDPEGFDGTVVVKNIDIRGKNVITHADDLSFEGGMYALKKGQEEDPFTVEPVYVRSL